MSFVRPQTAEELRETVAWAVAEEAPLEIVGAGTKRGIGRAMQTRLGIDLTALSGVTLYDPEELILSAQAGTPRSEAEAMLAERRQAFAFEPPDLSSLLGSEHAGTLGGMIASNLSGPRRIKAGAVRDHFLGFHAVSGRGEIFQSGSRVMKNVTGYDLPKLMAGSWGTLAVMTSVTLKVLPRAETETTLLLQGLDDQTAARAMSAAMQSSCEVSGAAHLPASVAASSAVGPVREAVGAVTLLRLEGDAPSVAFRKRQLPEILAPFARGAEIEGEVSRQAWAEIRDVRLLAEPRDRFVWRISVPPMEGPRVLAGIRETVDARGYYDWAGGLVWVSVTPSGHASAEAIRATFAACGGHATLIRAPLDVRASVAVFEPQTAALIALTRRVKAAFDPKGILNPGRMSL